MITLEKIEPHNEAKSCYLVKAYGKSIGFIEEWGFTGIVGYNWAANSGGTRSAWHTKVGALSAVIERGSFVVAEMALKGIVDEES